MVSVADEHCGSGGPDCEKMIHLGRLPDMDVREKTPGAEKAGITLGGKGFGSTGDPLFRHLVEVSADDRNQDGIIRSDDGRYGSRSEPIRHDADGDGNIGSYKVDSAFIVKNTSVTFANPDGSTQTLLLAVRVMQDSAGNTFLMPPPKGAPTSEVEALTTRPILSVNFPTDPRSYDINHDGIFTDRHCFPCFARGTLIETAQGPLPVEALRPGLLVMTRDRGLQPLRWTGSRVLDRRTLALHPNLRPIRIAAGALGMGLPRRDLIVSPQHRVLVRSKIAQKMFGCPEILVAAKQLLQIEGIDIASDLMSVEYFHFLFDRHEIVLSEGAETESLYTGAEALKALGPVARAEILAIFPQLRARPEDPTPSGARPLVSGRMGRKLAVRHAQHHRALLQ